MLLHPIRLLSVIRIDTNLIGRTLDRVSLACTSLTIRKDGAIISIQTAVYNRFGHLSEHVCLANFFISNEIEFETLLLVRSLENGDRVILDFDTIRLASHGAMVDLVEGADADAHFEIVILLAG